MKNFKFADRMNNIGTEKAFEVLAKCRKLEAKGADIIHLQIGEPDFATPQNIVEAGRQALKDGYTHYTPNAGMMDVREAIAEYAKKLKISTPMRRKSLSFPVGNPSCFIPLWRWSIRATK